MLEHYLVLADGEHTIDGKGLMTDIRWDQKISVVA